MRRPFSIAAGGGSARRRVVAIIRGTRFLRGHHHGPRRDRLGEAGVLRRSRGARGVRESRAEGRGRPGRLAADRDLDRPRTTTTSRFPPARRPADRIQQRAQGQRRVLAVLLAHGDRDVPADRRPAGQSRASCTSTAATWRSTWRNTWTWPARHCAGTSWRGNTAYPARKNMLITTTDRQLQLRGDVPGDRRLRRQRRRSCSGAAAEQRCCRTVSPALPGPGLHAEHARGPLRGLPRPRHGQDAAGLLYEAQFVDAAVRGDGSIRPDMRLLYPSPTVLCKHTLVPFDPPGDRVGRLLTDRPRAAAPRRAARLPHRRPRAVRRGRRRAPGPGRGRPGRRRRAPPPYDTLEHLLDACRGVVRQTRSPHGR